MTAMSNNLKVVKVAVFSIFENKKFLFRLYIMTSFVKYDNIWRKEGEIWKKRKLSSKVGESHL